MSHTSRPFQGPLPAGEERSATSGVNPPGFHLRPPPAAHERTAFVTDDASLFETIHMGPAVVNHDRWKLQVDGFVANSFSIDLEGLRSLPQTTITAFHECWGSPLRPRQQNLLRVGNVRWTGVRLKTLLAEAAPLPEARFVWTEGLDSGDFGGKTMDCYRKDLPLDKAWSDEVLVCFAMNDEPLRKERGGPVRLIVPGWFGTNMTKWLCRLSLQAGRAPGPFTNDWYNEEVVVDGIKGTKPVWEAVPNSMIVAPADGATCTSIVDVRGWAWGAHPIATVHISSDGGQSWSKAPVKTREEFEWQAFHCVLQLPFDACHDLRIVARATDVRGQSQPLNPGGNSCHGVTVRVGAQRPDHDQL